MPTTTGFATDLITFSRGSLATVTDSNGYIKWAPHNLLLASEQFDASYWTKAGSTLAANNVVSPNGTTTADTLTASAGSSTHCLFSAGVTIQTATNYTYAAFLKKGTHNYATIIALSGSTSWVAITVDFSGSSPVISQTGAGAGGTYVTSGIEAVSNGFYRVWFTASLTVAPVQMEIALSSTATPTYGSYGEVSWSAAGTETIALWGAHLYRSDLGGMQANASAYPYYNPSTPKNLLGFSEDFSVGSWSKSNTTVSANATSAPNGSLSADLLYPATTGTARQAVQSASGVASTPYTNSVYVKSAGFQWVALTSPSGNSFGVYFDIINGVKGAEVSGCVGSIAPMGNGWFRCSVTQTVAGTTLYTGAALVDGDSNTTATASGTSGVYLWGAQLSDSASLDPYTPNFGAAPSAAAAYGPRLDYDPSTLAAKGLLVEEQRTNLVTYSDQLSNVAWTKNGTTVTADAVVGPNGVFSMDKIVATAANVQHNILMPSIANGSAVYTYSFYAKKAEETVCVVDFGGVSTITATFNLDTGTVVSSTGVVASIISAGNGIYRCIVTTSTAVDPSAGYRPFIAPRQFTAYAGDGTSGIYIYGAQLEAGSFATSYIPTAAASVTRNADVASVATSQFPYSATEGTLVVNGTLLKADVNVVAPLTSLSNGSFSESINIYKELASPGIALTVYDGSALQAVYQVPFTVQPVKVAIAYKLNDTNGAVNGVAQTTDTTCTLPTVDRLDIGSMWTGNSYLNGHIRQITYLPRRISNAELQQRTA